MSALVESVSILAITICMIVLFVRSGRGDFAASLTPILIVPFMHSLAWLALRLMSRMVPMFHAKVILSFADIIGLAIACLLLFFFSTKIKSTKNKKLYIVLLSGYNIILACVFVYQTMFSLLV
ncbi:MAG: hypothetical protein KBG54_06010 [Oscillospiraceae bacterium]|nr:hypothetical protein [Oscillospiraceae bacterium]